MTKQQISYRKYAMTLMRAGRDSFQLSPSAGIIQIIDSMVQALLPIVTTYFAALTTTALVDAYAGDETASSRVFWYVLATSAVSIVMLLWSSLSTYIRQKTRYRIDAAIEDQMMVQLSSLPFMLYDDKSTIDMYERARRFSYYFSQVFMVLGNMLTRFIGAIGALLALVSVSGWVALAVFVALIPGLIIQIRLARQQSEHWDANILTRRRKNNLGWMLQDYQYIAEMRVYGLAKHLIEKHAKLRDADEKQRLEYELRTTWKRTAADVLEAFVELAALVWIVLQIIAQSQPVGQFLYVQQMVARALSQAGGLASELGNIDEELANAVDYQNFMELAVEPDDGIELTKPPQKIEIDKLSFHYPNTERSVLRDVSLAVESGQHIAIVGENGAGKSTLIKLIMGLYEPSSGFIRLDETPLDDYLVSSWHHQIALLSQDFIQYQFATIGENITLGDVTIRPNHVRLERAMQAAELDTVVDNLRHGVDTYIERWMAQDSDEATGIELSGGQSQRMALARNFYRDAPIMLLDEPTSAIDALAEARIFKRLFASDKTIIVVSHRLSTIQKADVVYMMQDGQIVERGKASELVEKRGEFYRMFEGQI